MHCFIFESFILLSIYEVTITSIYQLSLSFAQLMRKQTLLRQKLGRDPHCRRKSQASLPGQHLLARMKLGAQSLKLYRLMNRFAIRKRRSQSHRRHGRLQSFHLSFSMIWGFPFSGRQPGEQTREQKVAANKSKKLGQIAVVFTPNRW